MFSISRSGSGRSSAGSHTPSKNSEFEGSQAGEAPPASEATSASSTVAPTETINGMQQLQQFPQPPVPAEAFPIPEPQLLANFPQNQQASLQQGSFQQADVQQANAAHANLQHASLQQTALQHANHQHANVQHANVHPVNLQHANMQHANVQHASPQQLSLRPSTYQQNDFQQATINQASFQQQHDAQLQRHHQQYRHQQQQHQRRLQQHQHQRQQHQYLAVSHVPPKDMYSGFMVSPSMQPLSLGMHNNGLMAMSPVMHQRSSNFRGGAPYYLKSNENAAATDVPVIGGKRNVRRRKKDKSAPKRALTAYMIFSKETRPSVVSENPALSFTEVGRMLGEKWRALSPELKAPFEMKSATDKERYRNEREEYMRMRKAMFV